MKLNLPKGRRQSDLVRHSGTTYWFGGAVNPTRSGWTFLAENLTILIFVVLAIGMFLGAPASMPVRALMALAALLLIPVFITWTKRRTYGARDSIVINAGTGNVHFPKHLNIGDVHDLGDLTLWVHPAKVKFPGTGEVDLSDLQSREWWLSITGWTGGVKESRFVVPLYGPGARPDIEVAAQQIRQLGRWRELMIEGP